MKKIFTKCRLFSRNYDFKLTMESKENLLAVILVLLFVPNPLPYQHAWLLSLFVCSFAGCTDAPGGCWPQTSVWALHVCQSYLIRFRVYYACHVVFAFLRTRTQERRVFRVWTGSELNPDVAEREKKPFRTLIQFSSVVINAILFQAAAVLSQVLTPVELLYLFYIVSIFTAINEN